MERVNAFHTDEGWEFLDCVHNVALTLNCLECSEGRNDDPPAGELPTDGPAVIRERAVSRETKVRRLREIYSLDDVDRIIGWEETEL
jgi:hypothetical protein